MESRRRRVWRATAAEGSHEEELEHAFQTALFTVHDGDPLDEEDEAPRP